MRKVDQLVAVAREVVASPAVADAVAASPAEVDAVAADAAVAADVVVGVGVRRSSMGIPKNWLGSLLVSLPWLGRASRDRSACSQEALVRAVVPFVMAAAFLIAPAHGQPSSSAGTTSLIPNNCGTPDEPKSCASSKGVKAKSTAASAPEPQRGFASAEEAVSAFVTALRDQQEAELRAILGPEGDRVLDSGDRYADQELHRRFIELYDQKHTFGKKDSGHVELDVGPNDWPMPIPLIETNGRWTFDTNAGAQTVIDRRIGRNELSAILYAARMR